MPISYEITHNDEYLLITATGSYDSDEDITSYTRSFVEDLMRYAPQAVILDHRALSGSLDTLDAVKVAAGFAIIVKELRLMRIAVISRPERLQALKYLETTAQNLGIMGMSFTSLEEAEAWLRR